MPQIIPIRDLKNTGAISQMCHESVEPIYITKNGYGDMVIMSIKMGVFQNMMVFVDKIEKRGKVRTDPLAATEDAI